ncbi:transposase [Legionella fallonii]|uniref:transposase n=1 Tax=Legionella fallonii TaxID=96230 RepID=UPI000A01B2ED
MRLDNVKYYKNSLITAYLETSKIELLFLPIYSPNLNLIEQLWKFMYKNRKLINNGFTKNF